MPSLSKEDLLELHATITERLQEFDCKLPVLSLGVVRIMANVFDEHMQRKSTTLRPCSGQALQPLRSQAGDKEAQQKRQAEFDAIIAEIKHVAMAGIMPRMNTWDAAKPLHMPKSQAIINRYQKPWGELAEIAGLRMDKKETVTMKPVAHLNDTFME